MQPIDCVGILVCGVAAMIIGGLWYSPVLFANKWMKLQGLRPEDCKPHAGMWKTYLITFIGALIMALTLERILHNIVGAITLGDYLHISFACWLGFIAISMSSDYLFTFIKKSWKLYAINAGYYLVLLLVYGIIIYFI